MASLALPWPAKKCDGRAWIRYGQRMHKPTTAPGTRKYLANCWSRLSANLNKGRRPPMATAENVSTRHAAGTTFVKLAATESASEIEAREQPHLHSASAGLNSPRSAKRAMKYMATARLARPRMYPRAAG